MELDELERLAKEATPGPWEANEDGVATNINGRYRVILSSNMYDTRRAKDSTFVAACSPAVILRLVAIARAAEKVIPAMAECQEIARCWEPDDSSGKERQWLVRGREATAALREALSSS